MADVDISDSVISAVENVGEENNHHENNGLNGNESLIAGEGDDTNIPKIGDELAVKNEPADVEEGSEDGEVFEVEAVLQERSRKGIKEYLVRWKGYGDDYDTWEPEDNLNCDEIIEEFKNSLKAKKKAPVGRRRKVVEKPPSEDEEEEKEDDDEDYEEEASVPQKRRRRKTEKATVAAEEIKEKRTPGRRGRPPGVTNKQPRQPRKKRTLSPERSNEPATIVKCKTRFKKFLIEYAIAAEDDRDLDADQSEDPCVKYFLKYDMDTSEFFVDNVKIEVNEEKKFLTCSFCKRTGPQWGRSAAMATATYARHLARSIFFHVVGQHKGGFHCLKCPDNMLEFHTKNIKDMNAHMAQVHRRSSKGNADGYEDNDDMDDQENQCSTATTVVALASD